LADSDSIDTSINTFGIVDHTVSPIVYFVHYGKILEVLMAIGDMFSELAA